ncbi:MAG: carboxypeptidase-like regulatory domain-containing protein, partial [Bacteroidetes bacterium]|nr:carboxypeptidase-like regulatory domain-containing protein [Bacteroidota bacterium]
MTCNEKFLRSFIFYFMLNISVIDAQIISGKVTNDFGQPLLYTNISVLNSNTGTTTNEDGFYLLKLSQGSFKIVFSYLGYRNDTLNVNISNNIFLTKDIQLKSISLEMDVVYVFPTDLNIAEEIILRALYEKQNYLSNLKNYIYDAYTKSSLKVLKNDTLISAGLLQSLSKGYYRYPNDFQEVVLAKKQTNNF